MGLSPSHASAIGLAIPFTFSTVSWDEVCLNFLSSVDTAFEVHGWAYWRDPVTHSLVIPFLLFPQDNQKHFLDDRRIFQFSAIFYRFCMKSYESKDLSFIIILACHLHQYSAGFFTLVWISFMDQETYLFFFLFIWYAIKMSPEQKPNERKGGYRNSFRVQ